MKNFMRSFVKVCLMSSFSLLTADAALCSEVGKICNGFRHVSLHEQPTVLSQEERFIQSVIDKEYNRDFVTRFVKVCPSQDILAQSAGVSRGTISKLKNPEIYGELMPSARHLWGWLQDKGILHLKKELQLTDKNIKTMAHSLSILDLSKSAIVDDELGTEMHPSNSLGCVRPRLASEVASYLRQMKGTFTTLNLADNLLSDDGLRMIVRELQNHEILEEINVSNNKIGDVGLRYLSPLLQLEHLKKINIAKNIGPGERTLQEFHDTIPLKNRKNVKIIVD